MPLVRRALAWLGPCLAVSSSLAAPPLVEFEAGGARYSLVGREITRGVEAWEFGLIPSPKGGPPPGLAGTDRDRRCDAFAGRLASLLLEAGRDEAFVRRDVSHGSDDYVARYFRTHQGYIVGQGGQLEIRLDGMNRIVGGALRMEAKRLPVFRLKSDAELDSLARASVPHPVTGPGFGRLRHIAVRDSLARPVFAVNFPVRIPGVEFWSVRVDSETGEVLSSAPKRPADYGGW